MNKFMIYFAAITAISCVPSAIRPDDIDLTRDRRWRNCSFYVTDHDCGLYSEEETRNECVLNAQANYLSQSSGRQRYWLRQHGCPSHIIDPI